ncbi:hypothetical protein TYRP_002876 [Tyrophagus putrescentiae]|nr:hypothetical protein TYRP_002876 [Tyrophagus putrescentiae]
MEAHHPTGVTPPRKRGLRSAVVSYKSWWWCYGDGDDNGRQGQNRVNENRQQQSGGGRDVAVSTMWSTHVVVTFAHKAALAPSAPSALLVMRQRLAAATEAKAKATAKLA